MRRALEQIAAALREIAYEMRLIRQELQRPKAIPPIPGARSRADVFAEPVER